MNSRKMYLIVIGLIVVLVVALIALWHYYFGLPNGQLPQSQVTISSSTAVTASSSSSSSSSSSGGTGTTEESVPANGTTTLGYEYTLETLSIDRGTWTVELATSSVEQTRGLSYRDSLGVHDGMLFIFSVPMVQTFWMKDMNFPLDMIWISGDTVAGFTQNAPAMPGVAFPTSTYSSPDNVDKVLEVNAGTVAQYNIKVGDKVTITPIAG